MSEENLNLEKEVLYLREKVKSLEVIIKDVWPTFKSDYLNFHICPNCSTNNKRFYMEALPLEVAEIKNATHECPKCNCRYRP